MESYAGIMTIAVVLAKITLGFICFQVFVIDFARFKVMNAVAGF